MENVAIDECLAGFGALLLCSMVMYSIYKGKTHPADSRLKDMEQLIKKFNHGLISAEEFEREKLRILGD